MILSLRDKALATQDCNRLRAYGVIACEAPVHTAEPRPYSQQQLTQASGFILTSQQAAYALPDEGRERPVFTVGRASAASARARGYYNVRWGPSDGAALADMIEQLMHKGAFLPDERLCWLRASKISYDVRARLAQVNQSVTQAVVYEMTDCPTFDADVVAALATGRVTGIMVLSKAQRKGLVRLLHHHDLWHHRAKIALYVVSQAVGEAASEDGWQAIHIARRKRAISVQAAVICHARARQA